MWSCSMAHRRMAETRPPSWPTAWISGSVARARTMSLETPSTSASTRGRPNMKVSISVSQERNRGLGRRIRRVRAPDDWYLKTGLDRATLAGALRRRSFSAARRIGKLLLLDTAGRDSHSAEGPTLGLRFGMTGRLLVDGKAGVDQLLYSSPREEERWDRLFVEFEDGGGLRVRDPRRLGGVELDPDDGRLGPDAASVTPAQLGAALGHRTAQLKSRLTDRRG